jgi:TonB family protein
VKLAMLFSITTAAPYSQPAPPQPVFREASVAQRAGAEDAEAAKSAGFQGTAIVFVAVDAYGAVENAQIAQGLGLGLDEKAIEAAKHFTFRAAAENGLPAPGVVAVEIPFRLPGAVWRRQSL